MLHNIQNVDVYLCYQKQIKLKIMQQETTTHYRVITPGTFSNIDTVCTNGKKNESSRKLIETLDEAKLAISHFGDCEHESSKQYWVDMAKECKLVKVITTIIPIII